MKLIKIFYLFAFFLFFQNYPVKANNLIDQLNIFFQKEYQLQKKKLNIIIYNKFIKNKICSKPIFSLVSNSNRFGWINVLSTCSQKKQYLRIKLQVHGEYIVAKKKIIRGTKIKKSDLLVKTGYLDTIPNGTYLNIYDVIDKVNLQNIAPFQPITSFMIRSFWLVKINQQVTVRLHGMNFDIIASAKALNNAGYNEIVRVQLNNYKVIKGVIDKNGEVIVTL